MYVFTSAAVYFPTLFTTRSFRVLEFLKLASCSVLCVPSRCCLLGQVHVQVVAFRKTALVLLPKLSRALIALILTALMACIHRSVYIRITSKRGERREKKGSKMIEVGVIVEGRPSPMGVFNSIGEMLSIYFSFHFSFI